MHAGNISIKKKNTVLVLWRPQNSLYGWSYVYVFTEMVAIVLEQSVVVVSEGDGQATICMNVVGSISTELTVFLSTSASGDFPGTADGRFVCVCVCVCLHVCLCKCSVCVCVCVCTKCDLESVHYTILCKRIVL